MRRTAIYQSAIGLLVTGVFSGSTLAATPDAGSLLQQQQNAQPQSLQRLPSQEQTVADRPAQTSLGDGVKVQIKSIRITGAQGLATEQELQALVQDATGKEYDFGGLQQLADQVNRYLVNKGWMLARAYLPRQDLTNGDLEIAVQQPRIEGSIEGDGVDVKAAPNLRLNPERIRKTVAAAVYQGNTTPNSEDLERAVLLLNDLPGMDAKSYLARGTTPNTTQIGIEATEGALFNGSAWVDNYGNRYTGVERANLMLNLNDPSRQGDQANLMLTTTRGTNIARVGYSLPLGYSGLRANAYIGTMTYAIGEEQAAQQSTGKSDTYGLGLTYPIIRKRESNLSTSLTYDAKALQDKTLGLVTRDRRADNITIGLSGDRYDRLGGGGLTNFLLGYTNGQLNLDGNAQDAATDRTTGKTQGNFQKVTYSFARLQKLVGDTSFFVTINGQAATQNLDSSEKFILGGPAGVRAYPGGEGSGDKGNILNLELRQDLPAARSLGWGDLQLLAFYDMGQITLQANPWMAAPNATASNSYTLEGIGLGLNLSKPGKYTVRLSWAQTLGDNAGRSLATGANSDGLKDNQRFWVFASVNL